VSDNYKKICYKNYQQCRVNVHNLAQLQIGAVWLKMSLELQSCPLFQINRRPKCPRSITFGQVY
jgi:hypothetical protein